MAFLTALGTQFFAATRMRLNLRRLHRAGGGAVRELFRLATALRQAADATESAAAPPAAPQLQCTGGELRALAQRVGASATKLVGALAAGPAAEASAAEATAASADVAAADSALQAALHAALAQAAQLEAAVAALGQEAGVLEGAGLACAGMGNRHVRHGQQLTSILASPLILATQRICTAPCPPLLLPHGIQACCYPRCTQAGRVERRHAELDRVERRLDALHAVRLLCAAPVRAAGCAALLHLLCASGGSGVPAGECSKRSDPNWRWFSSQDMFAGWQRVLAAEPGTAAALPPPQAQVRPAHSGEAEELEGQLAELYQAYLHMCDPDFCCCC